MPNTAFASALAQAKEREALDAERRQQEAKQRRALAQRELEAIEQQKAAKRLERNVRSFVEGFMVSVSNHAIKNTWRPGAIESVQNYCEILVCHKDHELPKLDTGLKRIVHDKFVYGVILSQGRIPKDYFVGQRQEWFAPLFAQKSEQHAKRQQNGTTWPVPRPSAPMMAR